MSERKLKPWLCALLVETRVGKGEYGEDVMPPAASCGVYF